MNKKKGITGIDYLLQKDNVTEAIIQYFLDLNCQLTKQTVNIKNNKGQNIISHFLIRHNPQLEKIKKFISMGAELLEPAFNIKKFITDEYFRVERKQLLYLNVSNGQVNEWIEFMLWLKEIQVNWDYVRINKKPPLHFFCSMENPEISILEDIMRNPIRRKLKFNYKTPFEYLLTSKNASQIPSKIIDLLIPEEELQTINKANISEYRNIILYCHLSKKNYQQLLLNKAIITLIHQYGYFFHWIICNPYISIETIQSFLDLGIDINITNQNNDTPLHSLLKQRNPRLEIVKFFLDNFADLKFQNTDKLNVWQTAYQNQIHNLEIIQEFLNNGCLITDRYYGRTNWCSPLQCACKLKKPNLDFIRTILKKYTILGRDKNGSTSFHYFLENSGDWKIIQLFCKIPGSIEKKNKKGVTPLHLIAKKVSLNKKRIKFLFSHKANFTIRDNDGQTPLKLTDSETQKLIMTFIKNKRKKSNLSNINILKITNNTNLQPVEEENTNSKVNKGIKNNLESGPIEVEDVSALFIKKGKGKGKISAREITKSQELGNNQKYIKSTQIYDKLKKINLIEIENNFKKIFKQNDFLTKKIDFLMKQDKIKTEKIKSLEKEVLNLKKTNKQL